MKTVEDVLAFYSSPQMKFKFWSSASKDATRRRFFFSTPFNWQKTIAAHFREFSAVQDSRGYVLSDYKNGELIESFFARFGAKAA